MDIKVSTAMLFAAASLSAAASDPLEGIWQATGGGPLMEVRASGGGSLSLVWLDGPAYALLPGTVVGKAVPGRVRGVYDCTACVDPVEGVEREALFVISLDPARPDRLAFGPYEQKTVLNPRRLLPRRLSGVVEKVDTRPEGMDGAVRAGSPPAHIEL